MGQSKQGVTAVPAVLDAHTLGAQQHYALM